MLSPPSARRAEAIGEGRGHLNWDTKVVAGVHRTLPLGPIFFAQRVWSSVQERSRLRAETGETGTVPSRR